MDDERITKRLFYGELAGGRCFVGGQRKRHKDTLKASLNDFGIDPALWESLLEERDAWRSLTIKGATAHQQNRTIFASPEKNSPAQAHRMMTMSALCDHSVPGLA